ncbi:purine-nucleoside phosphorylase [soil metagenome]
MSQLHVRAEPGAVAEHVLLPGDPNRARRIAERFLDDSVLYTDHRQMFGYTGTYRGLRVSVQTTGMGCPSLAIVVEELIRLGARTLIRVGTAGIVASEIAPGDLVVAHASVANDGTTRHYMHGQPFACVADFGVTRALVEAGTAAGTAPHVGLIRTDDAFYAVAPDDVTAIRATGVLAIEMEASMLFLLGSLRSVRTGCALVASNRIGDPSFVSQETLDGGVDAMTRMTLDACVALGTDAGRLDSTEHSRA